jgi:hypothetical protein
MDDRTGVWQREGVLLTLANSLPQQVRFANLLRSAVVPVSVTEPLPLPVTVRPLVVPTVSVPLPTARVSVRLPLRPLPMLMPLMAWLTFW